MYVSVFACSSPPPAIPFSQVGIALYFTYRNYGIRSINHHKDFRMSRRTMLVGWFCSFILITLAVFGAFTAYDEGYKEDWGPLRNALYLSTFRTSFSVGVGFVLLACIMMQGGVLNRFLSQYAFKVLSKLTYTAYLVHPIVVAVVNSRCVLLIRLPSIFQPSICTATWSPLI